MLLCLLSPRDSLALVSVCLCLFLSCSSLFLHNRVMVDTQLVRGELHLLLLSTTCYSLPWAYCRRGPSLFEPSTLTTRPRRIQILLMHTHHGTARRQRLSRVAHTCILFLGESSSVLLSRSHRTHTHTHTIGVYALFLTLGGHWLELLMCVCV